MMVALLIYGGFNLVMLVWWFYKIYHCEEWGSLFLYPRLFEQLEDAEVDGVGKIFMSILFTIMLLPAIVIYSAVVLAALIVALVLYLILRIFIKE
jgi:hypothetical protein